MRNTIAVITLVAALLPAPHVFAADRPLVDVKINNNTGVTLTVWAEYYHDHSLDPTRIIRSVEQEIPPGGSYEFALGVGVGSLHAEARGFDNPSSGKPYSAGKSYQRNNPGAGRKPNPVYWGVTYEDLGMPQSLRDPETKSFTGLWDCEGYALLDITVKGDTLGGETLIKKNGSYKWTETYGKGVISGDVVNDGRINLFIEFKNGDYVSGKPFNLHEGGDVMSGLAPIMYSNGAYKSGGAHSVRCERQ